MLVVVNYSCCSFCFRDYMLDKIKERERKELESKLFITIKGRAYADGSDSSALSIILGQGHVNIKDFRKDFSELASIYNDDVLVSFVIKKRFRALEYDLKLKFCGFDFLFFQILDESSIFSERFIFYRISKVLIFDLIRLLSFVMVKDFWYCSKLFFSYLETVVRGKRSKRVVVRLEFF